MSFESCLLDEVMSHCQGVKEGDGCHPSSGNKIIQYKKKTYIVHQNRYLHFCLALIVQKTLKGLVSVLVLVKMKIYVNFDG